MLTTTIQNFPTQFTFKPKIENANKLVKRKKYILAGMGGSRLVADVLLALYPTIDIHFHKEYGLPQCSDLKERLVVCNSYSGNTEETISTYKALKAKKIPLVCIAAGGELIELAKKDKVPYILIPKTGIQPRHAIGFSLMALMTVLGMKKEITQLRSLEKTLKPKMLEKKGRDLAQTLQNSVPLMYTSTQNSAIAENWKIKMNENGKIPAFWNVVPELCHNEMTGFDVIESTKSLSATFHCVFIIDKNDHERVQKRFKIIEKLYTARGLKVEKVMLSGKTRAEQVFNALLLGDWTSLALSEHYGTESEQVPMVEEFKNMMKK
jgi:glucose/mannose-6-phosphate isomerase